MCHLAQVSDNIQICYLVHMGVLICCCLHTQICIYRHESKITDLKNKKFLFKALTKVEGLMTRVMHSSHVPCKLLSLSTYLESK